MIYCSWVLPRDKSDLHYWTLLGVLAAAAAAIQVLESPLPRILPWLKPGLSNALVLFSIIKISPLFAIELVLLRTFLTGIFLGILFSPPNILAFLGGISAAASMSIVYKYGQRIFSIYGISIIGAITHNFAQLVGISVIFKAIVPLWFHFLLMIWIAVPSGLIVGYIANELLRRIP